MSQPTNEDLIFLTTDQKLNERTVQCLRESIDEATKGFRHQPRVLVLDQGMSVEYKRDLRVFIGNGFVVQACDEEHARMLLVSHGFEGYELREVRGVGVTRL